MKAYPFPDKFIFFLLSILFFEVGGACQSKKAQNPHPYYTASDSARYYYQKGWEQIMDQGFYGPAERSYRKALEFDPHFWVGKSVLARLTLDLEERLALESQLDSAQNYLEGDEALLNQVYLALTRYTNVRDQNPDQAPATLAKALQLAENNFRTLTHKYPNEVYLKAEYLEIIHSLHGAQAALDTMQVIASPKQQENHFIMGFAASLWAEKGDFAQAIDLAQTLEEQCDTNWPKPYAVWADIYFQMDSLSRAETLAQKALQLDPYNLDAGRIKLEVELKNLARRRKLPAGPPQGT